MRYTIFDTFTDALRNDWEAVSDWFDDPYIDPRMIEVVQRTVAGPRCFWNVIVYDEDDRPVAVACFYAERTDFLMMAPPAVRRFAELVRRVRYHFFRFPLLFCGLPASAGWNQLRVMPFADYAAAFSAVDRARNEIRREGWAWATMAMEFDDSECERLAPLQQAGYVPLDSPPMYVLPAAGRSFAEYVSEMKSHYRSRITASRRKFAAAGIRVVHYSGADDLEHVLTDEVHELYLQVLTHADVVMHRLGLEYFRALARAFGKDFLLSVAYDQARPVAFGCGIFSRTAYYWSFIGFDYATNQHTDLYFNLFYETLEHVMQRRLDRIYLGSDSDRFKQRIGCVPQRRRVFVRAHGLFDRIFQRTAHFWIPPQRTTVPAMDVFGAQNSPATRVSQYK